jgi:hypothetical protein
MAVKYGPNIPYCMPNRTNCVLLASVMLATSPSSLVPNYIGRKSYLRSFRGSGQHVGGRMHFGKASL